MLSNAIRLCDAKFGNSFLREADGFRSVAVHSMPSAYARVIGNNPFISLTQLYPEAPVAKLVATLGIIHIVDLTLERNAGCYRPLLWLNVCGGSD
jgi:two-component system, NtrC family, sensor kinase